jgi:hypothetical protein
MSMWLIGGAVVLAGGVIFWLSRRPKTFRYKGKSYTRHGDGSYVMPTVRLSWGSSMMRCETIGRARRRARPATARTAAAMGAMAAVAVAEAIEA